MALTAWSYLWRTTPVHRWEMTGSLSEDGPPELRADVDLTDVQGIDDGTGPIVHRIYRTRIVGGSLRSEELVQRIAADLDTIAPSEFATFQKLDGDGPLALGDDYVVRMPGPWDGPVRVVDVHLDRFRLATLTGHLEAGQIEFRARADYRGVEFTIESWARSGDRVSDLLYTHLRLSKEVQLHMWTSVLERVAKLAQGSIAGGIVITTRRVQVDRLQGAGAGGESRRVRRRLDGLAQRPVNFDASRISEYTPVTGWHLDDMVEPLPHEGGGPPVSDGTWQLARRLMVDYQLADPAIVRATYDRDAPLEGRNMLLEIRFLGVVRFGVGVRVGAVYDEEREVDGRSARVFGWVYQTLDGHFEQGEMHYQVWKWFDTGDVEFRLHAVSKAADTGPWILRTGFRVLGRPKQLRFYRQICRRIRRLTEAELEVGGARADNPRQPSGAVSSRDYDRRMPQSREERLAQNEANFRSLNESLGTRVHERLSGSGSNVPGFVCECGNGDCEDIIQVELSTYEEVRRDPCLFLLHPGHEAPDVEDVVQREDGYLVVRKHEEVADIVRETDPRR
jgi:uncharacterized protein (UPF0548 family)